MEKSTKKKIGNVVVLMLGISAIVFAWSWFTGGVEKTAEGELLDVKIFSRHDGNHDTVIVFNNSGSNEYVVINEWKTGQIIELSSHASKMVRIRYMYHELRDCNVLIGYELI